MSGRAETSLEVEVKFQVADLAALRQRLLAAGASLHKERVYEHNVRYENAWDGLLRQGKLLRLRQDSQVRLTYKGPAAEQAGSEAKVREELELELDDFATANDLLTRVGFEPRQVYEKYRETFVLGEVEVVLDEMPFGDFVELEGPEDAIRQTADLLSLDWQKRILENYLRIMARMKEQFDLPFDDLTFDNFARVDVSAADLRPD